jgi:hypothetical protein
VRIRDLLLAATLVCGSLVGCLHTDGGGHALSVLNDSDRDVVVEVTTGSTQAFVVGQHGYAGLSGGFDDVATNWSVTVRTTDCALIAKVPITSPRGVLYIGPDDRIEWHSDAAALATLKPGGTPTATACPG